MIPGFEALSLKDSPEGLVVWVPQTSHLSRSAPEEKAWNEGAEVCCCSPRAKGVTLRLSSAENLFLSE